MESSIETVLGGACCLAIYIHVDVPPLKGWLGMNVFVSGGKPSSYL